MRLQNAIIAIIPMIDTLDLVPILLAITHHVSHHHFCTANCMSHRYNLWHIVVPYSAATYRISEVIVDILKSPQTTRVNTCSTYSL